MAKILTTKSIYYNDVNLIAQPAKIGSRKDVPIELNRIIVSPMAAVVGQTFAKEATKLGLTVCQHKFCDIDNAVINYSVVPNKENLFVSIGLNDWDRARELAEEGASNWLIDCANGYLPQIHDVISKLLGKHKVNRLMVGNVMTADGIHLYSYFSKYVPEVLIRVGIAGGSACATSDATGYNRGQITEIIECSDQADIYNLKVIADGGIKNGNYAAKAFGAGCFIGNMSVKTKCGITNIDNIKIGDEVLTHTNTFKPVTRVFEYKYNGNIKVINGIKCTPTHEFYVLNKKYKDIVNDNNVSQYAEWVAAKDITNEYFLIKMD